MIKEVTIKNFKSVQDLTIPLSRFNILIGSNGSGKSNILEAIAFGGAASADKLDYEFLGSRGIRAADAPLMKSAFKTESFTLPIQLTFKNEVKKFVFTIEDESKAVLKWHIKEKKYIEEKRVSKLIPFFSGNFDEIKDYEHLSDAFKNTMKEISYEFKVLPKEQLSYLLNVINSESFVIELYKMELYSQEIANFIIYSPEITALRKLEEESQILPLGIKGEGLFNLLQIFNESYGEETITELKKYLHIIEWFDDFEAKYDQATGRKSLVVKDRYMPDVSLNQQNVNEGFLFLLFYVSLIISKETPAFFAIDNIEASFHPKLCEELIKQLIELAKIHNKQLILTTHNPYVLNGLNLQDEEQSLFVVRRNAEGETIADKITKQPQNIKLSEAWIRGYFGGQPETIE